LARSGTAPRITTEASVSATISASLSGTSDLAKFGPGTLTLAEENSYTGVSTISSGNATAGGILNASGDHPLTLAADRMTGKRQPPFQPW